jgi:hypothetical protein
LNHGTAFYLPTVPAAIVAITVVRRIDRHQELVHEQLASANTITPGGGDLGPLPQSRKSPPSYLLVIGHW